MPGTTGAPGGMPVQRSSLRQQIADALRDEVLSGRLAAGRHFTVKEIAELYGVSATPVREALVDLAAQGLLEVEHHRGFQVRRFTYDDYRSMIEARTLLTELEVDNSKGEILAGSYAQVRLADAKPVANITLPANTLLFRGEGPSVALVENGRLAIRQVKIGRDFGSAVEVESGVALTDQVVVNPSDSLVEGMEVRIGGQDGAPQAAQAKAGGH